MSDERDYGWDEPADRCIAVAYNYPNWDCALAAAGRLIYWYPAADILIEEIAGYGETPTDEARQAARRHRPGPCCDEGRIDIGGSPIIETLRRKGNLARARNPYPMRGDRR